MLHGMTQKVSTECGLQTILDLLPEGIFHHLLQSLSTTGESVGWHFRADITMESHLCPWHIALWMSQRPTGPLPLDGAFVFPEAQKRAMFRYLAPPQPRAVLVIPVLLNCTAEEKNLHTVVT